MDKNKFKIFFFRFLKENGVFPFISKEIKKEYNGIDYFIDFVYDNRYVYGIFNLKRVLEFEWENNGTPYLNGYDFWKNIHETWQKMLSLSHFNYN